MILENAKKAGSKFWSWLVMTLTLSIVALAVLAVWAVFQFGSIGNALSYSAGQRLIPDSTTRSFGNLWRGGESRTVIFRLTNFARRPITLVGARSQCTCAAVSTSLPLTIPPSEARPLAVRVRPTNPGTRRETIRVYTDDPSQPELPLQVVGQIREPEGSTQSSLPAG